MKVDEIMSAPVITISEDAMAKEAFEMMRENGFRHLPVVNTHDLIVGVLSERDIRNVAILFERQPKGPDDYMIPGPVYVRDIMAKNPVILAPDLPVKEAAHAMIKDRFGCVPIVDSGILVGIVTEVDLMQLLLSFLDRDEQERPQTSGSTLVPEDVFLGTREGTWEGMNRVYHGFMFGLVDTVVDFNHSSPFK